MIKINLKLFFKKGLFPGLIIILSLLFFTLNLNHEPVTIEEYLAINHFDIHLSDYFKEIIHPAGFIKHLPVNHVLITVISSIPFINQLILFRIISVIAAIGSLIVIYWLVKKIFGKKTAWVSVLLVAFTPYYLTVAQEANGLMILVLIAIGSIFFLYRWMTSSSQFDQILFVIISSLGVFYHLYYLFLWFALSILIISIIIQRMLKKSSGKMMLVKKNLVFILAFPAQVLLVLLFRNIFVSHIHYLGEVIFNETFDFNTVLNIYLNFFTTKNSYDLNPIIHFSLKGFAVILILLSGVYINFVNRIRNMKNGFILKISIYYLMFILLFTLILNIPVLNYKYLIILYPLLMILAAFAMVSIRIPYFKYIAVGLLCIANLFSIMPVYFNRMNGSLDHLSQFIFNNQDLDQYSQSGIYVPDKKTYLLLKNYYAQDNLVYLQVNPAEKNFFIRQENDRIVRVEDLDHFRNLSNIILIITPDDQRVQKKMQDLLSFEKDYSREENNYVEKLSYMRHKIVYLKRMGE